MKRLARAFQLRCQTVRCPVTSPGALARGISRHLQQQSPRWALLRTAERLVSIDMQLALSFAQERSLLKQSKCYLETPASEVTLGHILLRLSENQQTFNRAMSQLLTAFPMTKRELRDRLLHHQYPESVTTIIDQEYAKIRFDRTVAEHILLSLSQQLSYEQQHRIRQDLVITLSHDRYYPLHLAYILTHLLSSYQLRLPNPLDLAHLLTAHAVLPHFIVIGTTHDLEHPEGNAPIILRYHTCTQKLAYYLATGPSLHHLFLVEEQPALILSERGSSPSY